MSISERKKKILRSVVDEYIETASPVSSKVLTEKYVTDVSSATVRNELAALEELGYLKQLHTSGGRVPSPAAYKFYIQTLMEHDELSEEDLEFVRRSFTNRTNDIEHIVRDVASVISELTDYTSVAIAPQLEDECIENIALFPCGEEALLLIRTNVRLLRDNFIAIPAEMNQSDLQNASNIISRLFVGKSFSDVDEVEEAVLEEFASYKQVLDEVMDALMAYRKSRSGVAVAGEDKIFNHPEYDDIGNVKNFLSVISSKEKLADILEEGNDEIKINVTIGTDSEKVPDSCSLVTASYSVGGKSLGTYGVLGPIRMDYQKVISVLDSVGKVLENIINQKGK